MRTLAAAFTLGLLAVGSSAVQAKDYDICVIGAGAGGTAAAVYGTKRGYSVLVVDIQSNLGGHCDTYIPPSSILPPGAQPFIDTGVAQLADTKKINTKLGPLPDGSARWQVDTKKYVDNFVKDPNYLVGLNIPEDPFTNSAGIYAVDEGIGLVDGPHFNQSLLPDQSDPVVQRIFGDLQELTFVTYPWLDNGEVHGPIPQELLVPFGTFMAQRNWTESPAMINLFKSILWYAVAMDKFDTLPTYYALRFLAPTPQLLFGDKDHWYGFNGGCQRLYDNIYDQLKSRPCNGVLVNTTVTSVDRPQPSIWDWLTKPKITLKGFTLGVDTKGNTTNTTFTHTCGSLILGMPAVPASLRSMGLQLDDKEMDVFGTVKTHGYFGGAVLSTGRAVNETAFNNGFYNILHINAADLPYQLSRGDPTWISLQGAYGATSPSFSLLAGFSSSDMSQKDARNAMQTQLNAHLTQSIDGGNTPALLTTANIVDFHAHRYQARPATAQLARADGWYDQITGLQGYRHTFWTGATVNFPLHHVCINEAYKLITHYFPDKCDQSNAFDHFICMVKGRLVDWDL